MLESGFYYENSIGEYEISTFHRVIGFLPVTEHPEIIYRKKYLGKRTIYRPSLNQDSPLMAFANLDSVLGKTSSKNNERRNRDIYR